MSRRRVVGVAWLVAASALFPGPAAAVAGGAPAVDVVAGFRGRWRIGAWTPLVLSVTGSGSAAAGGVRVWAEDMDGQLVRSPPAVLAAVPGGVEARTCVRFGRPSGRYRVELGRATGGAELLAERRLDDPLASTAKMLVCYGTLPATVRAARLVDRDRGTSTTVVADAPPYAASSSPRDFDAADAVVVCGSAVASLPEGLLEGIDAWVRGGGRLVFACGAAAETVAAGNTVAAAWLPGTFSRLVPLRRPGPIEAFARAGGLSERVPPDGLPVPRFDDGTAAMVDVAAADGPRGQPLVTRAARGLGTVTWIGLDLDLDPIRGWAGVETLLAAALAGRSRGGLDPRPAESGGLDDLGGQLHAALDSFAGGGPGGRGVAAVPFELVAAVGLAYVLCLYPLDWWIVSRLGRPSLAWLTLPVLAAAFTLGTMVMKDRWIAAPRPIVRTADVVDVDSATRTVRGSAWVAVHSPGNGLVDVAVAGGVGSPCGGGGAAVSWWGVSGRGLGGLDAAAPHPSLASADYGYAGSLEALAEVPVAAAASRLFEAEWTACLERPAVRSTLARTGQGTLEGAVSHELPFPLDDCRLLHAGWLYDVGRLPPGGRFDTAAGRGPRSLAAALTRRAATRDRESAIRWDASGTDVAAIVDLAGFHAAAGGTGYSGLDSGRLGRLDLSPLLAVDRAVLVGRIAGGAAATRWDVRVAGEGAAAVPAAATVCRIVIPVAPEAGP